MLGTKAQAPSSQDYLVHGSNSDLPQADHDTGPRIWTQILATYDIGGHLQWNLLPLDRIGKNNV